MAVIKTMENKNCRMYLHDDCMVKTKEERDEVMKRVSRLILEYYRNKRESA